MSIHTQRKHVQEPPVMVIELSDGRFHLEGRDWFYVYKPDRPLDADELAAKLEILRRKWVFKSFEWVGNQ